MNGPLSFRETAAQVSETNVGIFGATGSFSEDAAISYAQREGLRARIVVCGTPDGVLEALHRGVVDVGVLPVFNSAAGWVQASLEALQRRHSRVERELILPIRHCLITRSRAIGTHDVTRIASHPQALEQCSEYLASVFPDRERIEWNDTASAARDLKKGVLPPTTAIIASRRAARIRDLFVLAEDVQNCSDNQTTFVVIKRHER